MKQHHYLIIGGNSGIGASLTQQLLTEGHKITALSRNPIPETQHHPQLNWQKSDVLDTAIPLPEISDTIDGIAYCPGSINLKPFRSLKPEDFQNDFNINLMGAVRIIQQYLPSLLKSEIASLLLFSSVAAQAGMSFHASIAAAKGAVEGFGKALAAELAPKVRVNVIAPSLTNTPLATRLLNHETKEKAAADRHPLKRIGQPADVAALAAFLLSPKSSWITGQVIGADGGMSTIR